MIPDIDRFPHNSSHRGTIQCYINRYIAYSWFFARYIHVCEKFILYNVKLRTRWYKEQIHQYSR